MVQPRRRILAITKHGAIAHREATQPRAAHAPDIRVTVAGVATIQGVSDAGIEWMRAHVPAEPWQGTVEDGIAAEPSMAQDIACAAEADGLKVERVE